MQFPHDCIAHECLVLWTWQGRASVPALPPCSLEHSDTYSYCIISIWSHHLPMIGWMLFFLCYTGACWRHTAHAWQWHFPPSCVAALHDRWFQHCYNFNITSYNICLQTLIYFCSLWYYRLGMARGATAWQQCSFVLLKTNKQTNQKFLCIMVDVLKKCS